jgi:hypothetical protein
MNDDQIRERLAKIKGLFAGATTAGERNAAEAALARIEIKMQRAKGAPVDQEYRFSLSNPWPVRLFIALCRSKGMKPYRYARMRRTSLCVKGEPAVLNLAVLKDQDSQFIDPLTRRLPGLKPQFLRPEYSMGIYRPIGRCNASLAAEPT